MKLAIALVSVIQIIWTGVEGASNVGAIFIPGTATGPEAGSWMLSCLSASTNRQFNNNDKVALNYLY